MSGLFKAFKTDETKTQDGVLVQFNEAKNESDGTIPGFYVRYSGGKGSTAYRAALDAAAKPYRRRIDNGEIKAQEQLNEITNGIFSDHWIAGWENVRDANDAEIPYSKEAARDLMKQLPELLYKLIGTSIDSDNYRIEELKESSKN